MLLFLLVAASSHAQVIGPTRAKGPKSDHVASIHDHQQLRHLGSIDYYDTAGPSEETEQAEVALPGAIGRWGDDIQVGGLWSTYAIPGDPEVRPGDDITESRRPHYKRCAGEKEDGTWEEIPCPRPHARDTGVYESPFPFFLSEPENPNAARPESTYERRGSVTIQKGGVVIDGVLQK